MTEKTYTMEDLDRFAAAIDAADIDCSNAQWEMVLSHLTRPKHNFSEGQVIAYQGVEGSEKWNYCVIPAYKMNMPTRPISLTEAGPPYQKLVDAVKAYLRPSDDNHSIISLSVALAQFYQEIGDELA